MDEPVLYQNIADAVLRHFGSKISFVVLFGSRARKEHNKDSDIDLMVVFKEFKPCENDINSFREYFIAIQKEHGLRVDYHFPGEYVALRDLEKSISGYGFVRQSEFVSIEMIGPEDWTPFNEYREWLHAIVGPNLFLCGDFELYEKLKNEAVSTLIILAVCNKNLDLFNVNDVVEMILNGGKNYLGYYKTPYTKKYLKKKFEFGFQRLVEKNLLYQGGRKFFLDKKKSLKFLSGIKTTKDMGFGDYFLGHESSKKVFSCLYKTLELAIKHFVSSDRVLEYKKEEDIRSSFLKVLPTKGKAMDEILQEAVDTVMKFSISQSSKNYLSFPDAGNSVAGLCAEILIPFLNQNLIAVEKSAPTGTFVEIQVIQWFRELVGYSNCSKYPDSALDVGGIITNGGVMANTIGLLAARTKMLPNSRRRGLDNHSLKPIVLIAGKTFNHYSHTAASWWLGIGEENVVSIKIDEKYRLDYSDLESKINFYSNGNSRVIALICQAGDSRTTTIENFSRISELTQNGKYPKCKTLFLPLN